MVIFDGYKLTLKHAIIIDNMRVGKSSRGFTIVELLIVIVVIGILAALVLNSFAGAQAKARDAKRQTDIESLVKGLEVYYAANGRYPSSYDGSTAINGSWTTTADSSWQTFITALKPYMGDVPVDPISSPNMAVTSGTGFNYAYFSDAGNSICSSNSNQIYLLVYRLEIASQSNTFIGNCPGTAAGPYGGVSNYRKTQL